MKYKKRKADGDLITSELKRTKNEVDHQFITKAYTIKMALRKILKRQQLLPIIENVVENMTQITYEVTEIS